MKNRLIKIVSRNRNHSKLFTIIGVLLFVNSFYGNIGMAYSDNVVGVSQNEPRPGKEFKSVRAVSGFNQLESKGVMPMQKAILLPGSPLSIPTPADKALVRISQFANSIKENLVDVNRDGLINDDDRVDAQSFFEEALGSSALSENLVDILDQNGDQVFDQKDVEKYIALLVKEIENINKIREFADIWAEDPIDLNRDAVIDVDDVDTLSQELNRLSEVRYLPEETIEKLDQDGDYIISQEDMNRIAITMGRYIQDVEELDEFAYRIRAAGVDVNRDYEIDERDIQEGMVHYGMAIVAPHLTLDIIEAMDFNGDALIDHIDMELFRFRVECEKNGILLGDLDNDQDVDIEDYVEFQLHYGSKVGDNHYMPRADLDGDGLINRTDFTLLKASFEQLG